MPAAISSFLSSNQSINASVSALSAFDVVTVCFDKSEEPALITDQCTDALVNSDFASLPPTKRLTFTSRTSPLSIGQIGLPRRYYSSDGKCAIEPYLQSGIFKTYNTARNFNQATNKIIHDCVDHGTHRGGAGISVGGDDNLGIRVFNFKPQVQCYGSVNRKRMVTSCNNLANTMDASMEPRQFAMQHVAPESVLLPYREMDPAGGGCGLSVSFDKGKRHPSQFSNWYTVWQVFVAINAMCIRNGQRGRWLSIGYTIDNTGIMDVDVGDTIMALNAPDQWSTAKG